LYEAYQEAKVRNAENAKNATHAQKQGAPA
jgi:hypothetical protein